MRQTCSMKTREIVKKSDRTKWNCRTIWENPKYIFRRFRKRIGRRRKTNETVMETRVEFVYKNGRESGSLNKRFPFRPWQLRPVFNGIPDECVSISKRPAPSDVAAYPGPVRVRKYSRPARRVRVRLGERFPRSAAPVATRRPPTTTPPPPPPLTPTPTFTPLQCATAVRQQSTGRSRAAAPVCRVQTIRFRAIRIVRFFSRSSVCPIHRHVRCFRRALFNFRTTVYYCEKTIRHLPNGVTRTDTWSVSSVVRVVVGDRRVLPAIALQTASIGFRSFMAIALEVSNVQKETPTARITVL